MKTRKDSTRDLVLERLALEDYILKCISEFEDVTGCRVKEVHLHRTVFDMKAHRAKFGDLERTVVDVALPAVAPASSNFKPEA